MQLGILGLPKSGKTTLFNTLTAAHHDTGKFHASKKTHVGIAKVPDPRLEKLRDLFNPKRYTPATVGYVDIPGIRKGDGPESLDLAELRTVDALLHVVRAFDDPEIPHPQGSVDPARDVATIDLELIFADHEVVERRLARLAKEAQRGLDADLKRQQELLADLVLPTLEAERPLREIDLDGDDEKRLRGFQLLSAKPILVVLNVDEERVADTDPAEFGVVPGEHSQTLVVSAPIEEEISRLAPEEQAEFLEDLGLAEPSLHRLLRASFELLGRIAFFTVGEGEVRVMDHPPRHPRPRRRRRHPLRPEARFHPRRGRSAGTICCASGPSPPPATRGCLRLEGKDYVIRDGDISHFRFNV